MPTAGDRVPPWMEGRVGIQMAASTPATELATVAAEAEELGYCEIWLAEDYFDLGGVASAAIGLGATAGIPIGLGVVAAPARHPAVTAMEFATLGAAYPGRFLAGIGHGSPGWVKQMGLTPASPIGLLREATSSIAQLMRGERVSADGKYFKFDGVQLSQPLSEPVRLFTGVHGPRSLRLSGELADGTLLGWFSCPRYVAWARQRIDEGRARAERADHHDLVALCVVSISEEDPSSARNRLKRWAAPLVAAMADSPQFAEGTTGIEKTQLLSWAESLDSEEHLLDDFWAAGTLEDCHRTINLLLEAGADRVVLVPNPGGHYCSTPEMVEQIRIASKLAALDEDPVAMP